MSTSDPRCAVCKVPLPCMCMKTITMKSGGGCEWTCSQCHVAMTSLADGITWCPECGKVTSVFCGQLIPRKATWNNRGT